MVRNSHFNLGQTACRFLPYSLLPRRRRAWRIVVSASASGERARARALVGEFSTAASAASASASAWRFMLVFHVAFMHTSIRGLFCEETW